MTAVRIASLAIGIVLAALSNALAAQTNVAVAANFAEPAKEIAALFKKKTGHEAVLSFGSSGQFYSQITQDAPFQVFLSADDERPKKLIEDGLERLIRWRDAMPSRRAPLLGSPDGPWNFCHRS